MHEEYWETKEELAGALFGKSGWGGARLYNGDDPIDEVKQFPVTIFF